MKNILPISLIVIGYLGRTFFGNYEGHMIPFPGAFYILSWALMISGLLIFAFRWAGKFMDKPSVSPAIQSSIDRLKSTGERITLNFDNCEFKGRENMRQPEDRERALGYVAIGAYYALLDEQLAAQPKDSSQSALVYLHKTGDQLERFQSPVYPISEIGLQAHILKGDLILFVDRSDRKNFYFELRAS